MVVGNRPDCELGWVEAARRPAFSLASPAYGSRDGFFLRFFHAIAFGNREGVLGG
jgi:hypothetical protein